MSTSNKCRSAVILARAKASRSWLIHTAWHRDRYREQDQDTWVLLQCRNVHTGPTQGQEVDPLSAVVPVPFPVPVQVLVPSVRISHYSALHNMENGGNFSDVSLSANLRSLVNV